MNHGWQLQNLSAVIVNHQDWSGTIAQLRALYQLDPQAFAAVDWWVVDNSPDQSHLLPFRTAPYSFDEVITQATTVAELLDDDHDPSWQQHVRVLRRDNRGYGRAINDVAKLSERKFLIALNSDLLPRAGLLGGLAEIIAEQSSEAGRSAGRSKRAKSKEAIAWGMSLVDEDGSWQGSVGVFPSLVSLLIGQIAPRSQRKYVRVQNAGPVRVPWVTGASMLLNRERFLELGGFDDRFFMYYEDVDFCLRAHAAGYAIMFDPRCEFYHLRPYHSRDLTIRMVYQARHGLMRFFRHHRPRWEFMALYWIIRAECYFRGLRNGWQVVDWMAREYYVDPDAYRLDMNLIEEGIWDQPVAHQLALSLSRTR